MLPGSRGVDGGCGAEDSTESTGKKAEVAGEESRPRGPQRPALRRRVAGLLYTRARARPTLRPASSEALHPPGRLACGCQAAGSVR